nr:catalase [Streptantibioticus parmotrematis]
MDGFRAHPEHSALTTDQGVRIDDTDNALRAGTRGPTLLEDFHNREKITHFDHERIPERVVHARGAGAYGYFEAYESLAEYTCADFLGEAGRRTPVFVRFSTVQGPRGSADTVRDVRGFATKFYTREGNYDLVGNNFPVFFVQDAVKFPDFVHAVKMEPDSEMPTGASAHDTFWDFCSLQPESTHMLMWLMSDRAIPRSYRMMQGFGVHTFRFVTDDGRGTLVKFHWRPKLGVHSLVWDEAQIAAGRDPDFNRRDLWEAIESGDHPEWELGVQLVPEGDEHAFGFDLLDATKIIPEEQVPVRPIGRMVLDRNPQNFFAETEQVAFHTANVVPGIDFTNDPLLQGRNFSYLDTQLIRLGGPNFSQIPINRPLAEVHHNHRDGYGQQVIHPGTNYFPNSLGGGCPAHAGAGGGAGVFRHYQERIDGEKIRVRSASFDDHYSQAALFWNSMADWERRHIVEAFRFELGKVESAAVQQRMVDNLGNVDPELAAQVADGLGMTAPTQSRRGSEEVSPALSQENLRAPGICTRKVAVLVAEGTDAAQTDAMRERLADEGAVVEVLAEKGGIVGGADGTAIEVDRALRTAASVLYDAVAVPGGAEAVETLEADPAAVRFVAEAYRHGKPLAMLGEASRLMHAAGLPVTVVDDPAPSQGLCVGAGEVADRVTREFVSAIEQHRFPVRPGMFG